MDGWVWVCVWVVAVVMMVGCVGVWVGGGGWGWGVGGAAPLAGPRAPGHARHTHTHTHTHTPDFPQDGADRQDEAEGAHASPGARLCHVPAALRLVVLAACRGRRPGVCGWHAATQLGEAALFKQRPAAPAGDESRGLQTSRPSKLVVWCTSHPLLAERPPVQPGMQQRGDGRKCQPSTKTQRRDAAQKDHGACWLAVHRSDPPLGLVSSS